MFKLCESRIMKTRPFFFRIFFLFGQKQVQNAKNKIPKKNSDVATKLHYFSNEKQKIKTCSIQKKSISLPVDS